MKIVCVHTAIQYPKVLVRKASEVKDKFTKLNQSFSTESN